MYKLSCNLFEKPVQGDNLHKQFVQVATCTRLSVQVVTCSEFHHDIKTTCTILLFMLDLKRILVKFTILL